MADKEVTTKVVLQGDSQGMEHAMAKAIAGMTDLGHHINVQAGEATEAFTGLEAAIGRVGSIMVGIAAGAGLKKIMDEAAGWNVSAMKMGLTMGITSEEASVLQTALHGLGIENDVAQNAALRLSAALAKGTDKFDRFGITVRDSNGNLLPMTQIMANVNEKLLETKSGADRNVIAMALYGKSWKELAAILRYTPEAMDEARKMAERLHLVVGPEGIARSLQYQKNLQEVKLVAESLAIQFGNELMPAVVSVSEAMALQGTGGASMFGKAIKGAVRDTQEAVVYLASLADKWGAWNDTGGLLGHLFSGQKSADYKGAVANINAAAAAQKQEIAEVYDRKPKHSPDPTGDKINTDVLNQSRASDWTAAHNKYIEYEKTFEERRAAQVRIGNDMDLEVNRQAYAVGLIDLNTFLERKRKLTLGSLDAEVTARQNDLLSAQKALVGLKPVVDRKGMDNPSKDAENYHAAIQKEEQAQKGLAESVGKLSLEKSKLNDSDREAILQATRGYREQQAALLDLNNDFVAAAAIRRRLDEESHARAQLIAAAMTGDSAAEAAYWAAEAQDQLRSGEAAYRTTVLYGDLGIQLLELSGQYERAAKARRDLEQADPKFKLLPKDIKEARNRISDNNIAKGKAQDLDANVYAPAHKLQGVIGGDNYGSKIGGADEAFAKEKALLQSQYKDKLLLEGDFNEKMLHAKAQYAAEQQSIGLSMASDAIGIAKQGFSDNKAMSILALAAESAIAISRIIMNAQVAKSAADAAAQSAGIAAPALEAAAMARIDAGEMMSIGIVAASSVMQGVQIAGKRAAGGPVGGGSTYLVGEKGPELFTPGATGLITPNNALGGNGVSIVQHYDFRGADPGTEQRLRAEIKANGERTKADILNSMNRGGQFAHASGRMSR